MTEISFRKATFDDLDLLVPIFDHARRFMADSGNPCQWINGYPSREDLEEDIRHEHMVVCLDRNGRIVAAFCFMKGPDPTYSRIYQGQWLNDDDYHVIHRLASDGSVKGVARACFSWCLEHDRNLRADTHRDNCIMQHLLEASGFVRCGIILTPDGSERLAYQFHRKTS